MLQHHRDVFTNQLQTDFLLGRTAETNGPRRRRVKPQQQLHQSTFAAATGTDNRDFLSGGDRQVHLIHHQLIAVTEAQPLHLDTHGFPAFERIDATGVLRLVGPRQQFVDPRQRAARRVVGVLQIEQLFDRADHEPQVAEHREHLPDRQVGEQYREHRRRAEDVDAELKQQTTGAVRGIGLPLRVDRVIAHFLRTQAKPAKEEALAVAGAHFLNRIEGFTQGLSETRGAVVLQFLQVLDPLAQLHRGVDHQRVEQQDQQRQFPVHPHQDAGGADQGQHRHQKPAQGFADELVESVQIGDQMGGHGAAAEAFVFAEGDTFEAFDQAHTNAVDDVFRQPGKQARLQHAKTQGAATQRQGDHQHQADVSRRLLPHRRQHVIHDFQRGIAMAEQDFVHQQGQQQRNRHTAQRRQHGHAVGYPQRLFVMQCQAPNFCPAQPVDTLYGWRVIGQVRHRRRAPASDQAAARVR